MKNRDEIAEKMIKAMNNNLGAFGEWSAAKECADVAIQYAIDALKETYTNYKIGSSFEKRIDYKISELQSLLKQPQP